MNLISGTNNVKFKDVRWNFKVHPEMYCIRHNKKQEILGRNNRLLSLIHHGQHRKRLVQQLFYCCMFFRSSDNVFTYPLPSNDRGDTYIDTQIDGRGL
jgi:hypothetical protein